ncbi:hypothetical protein ABID22_002924 [Pontibacter aydingkolensis]|uniref:SWFGD domain-containing protein n=1 Tax=Pontibacter aydingkolensis TaxID=1911536 RepID=A0ABS7CYB4_9BACT|nr:hypothetical protein [Pontibacter aydingkolensis]MBW7468507.1 hypothetical protein [Pontibacter aydingkolensis]
MEGKDRYDRTGNPEHRSQYRNNERRVDEDMYRGAYRFDNSSDHRNVSTWDWKRDRDRSQGDYNRNYNRDYNQNYNNDYNRDYNKSNRRAEESGSKRDHERDWSGQTHSNRGGYDADNYNTDSHYRNQGRSYRSGNSSNWNRPRHESDHDHYNYRSVRSRMDDRDRFVGGSSNFNANYGPDNYGRGGGENYGNMAGSLSFGYDGTSNYDPDWNRQYDPLSGHRQSYHGHYTSRHPDPNRNDFDENYENS